MSLSTLKYILHIIKNYSNWPEIVYKRIVNKQITRVVLRNGTSFVGGSKSLIIDVVEEVFIKKVYYSRFVKIKPGDVVVDVGANTGIFSLFAVTNGASTVYSVEPLAENVKFIKSNFLINHIKLPIIINSAISTKNGTTKLYLGDYDPHASLVDRSPSQNKKSRIVKSLKILTFLENNKIDRIDFLKIDCEGAEGIIIDSLSKNLCRRINKISMEYHNELSTVNSKEIIIKLNKYGYKTKKIEIDDLLGYIYAWR